MLERLLFCGLCNCNLQALAGLDAAKKRPEVVAYGKQLLAIAPKMRAAIQASIEKTSFTITEEGPRKGKTCIPNGAGRDGGPANLPGAGSSCTDGGGRSYPELFYSGVLSAEQVDTIYETVTTSNNSKYPTRPMTLGCAGYNNKQVTFWAYGIPYGLLQVRALQRAVCTKRVASGTGRGLFGALLTSSNPCSARHGGAVYVALLRYGGAHLHPWVLDHS